MKKVLLVLALTAAVSGCSREDSLEIPAGSDVTVQKKDGINVAGRLIEVKPEHVVIEGADGVKRTVPRSNIAELRATPRTSDAPATTQPAAGMQPVATTGDSAPPVEPLPNAAMDPDRSPSRDARASARNAGTGMASEFREVTVPAGTMLPLTLRTSVGSDTSNVEDPVRASLRRAVTINGVQALPAGTVVTGHVTSAQRSARVKGRGQVAFRFTRLDAPGEGGAVNIRTGAVSRTAPGTKKRDAATIGGGAVGGAIIGGILGGGDGAAKGAAIGGAGGTSVVLATRGKEVRLAAGTPVSVRLTAPLTVRVPVR